MKVKDIENIDIQGYINANDFDYMIDIEFELHLVDKEREIESIYYDIDFECIIVLLRDV